MWFLASWDTTGRNAFRKHRHELDGYIPPTSRYLDSIILPLKNGDGGKEWRAFQKIGRSDLFHILRRTGSPRPTQISQPIRLMRLDWQLRTNSTARLIGAHVCSPIKAKQWYRISPVLMTKKICANGSFVRRYLISICDSLKRYDAFVECFRLLHI